MRSEANKFHIPTQEDLDPRSRAFYCQTLTILKDAEIPFLVGGTYAFERYTGIVRHTKDLDIFVRPQDCDRILNLFAAKGYQTEVSYPHWLAKVFHEGDFIDFIFNAANGNDPVDDVWIDRAIEETVFDIPVKICSPEEMLRSKAFVMSRDRYDGADVAHILRAVAEQLDWSHLVARFGSSWRILLSHLILFGFIYPSERSRIPNWVMQQLLTRLQDEMNSPPPTPKLCQGTLLSPLAYLVDIEHWEYQDARLSPIGGMTDRDIEQWTVGLQEQQPNNQ